MSLNIKRAYEDYKKGYRDGQAAERKKIMKIVDNVDDAAQAMYLLGKYIISEELKNDSEFI